MNFGRGAKKPEKTNLWLFILMFYVYILFSAKFDKYYVGHTDNLSRRLFQHNNLVKNTFTAKYRPWSLVASFETGPERGLAIKIENHIKKQKSKQFIMEIIQRNSIHDIIQRFDSKA
jgi:putative endonuclease